MNLTKTLIKEIVAAHIGNNLSFILANAKKNVHCKGMHSIVIKKDEETGLLWRIFITDKDHEMWKNSWSEEDGAWNDLSIGIHGHHCDLTLVHLAGTVDNVNFALKDANSTGEPDEFTAYQYKSALVYNESKFENIGKKNLFFAGYDHLEAGESVTLPAEALHTVSCRAGQVCAWMVIEEAAVNKRGDGITYSNTDLTKFSSEGMYTPMPTEEVFSLLKSIDLL